MTPSISPKNSVAKGPLGYRDAKHIRISFGYDQGLIAQVKALLERKFCQTQPSWTRPNTDESRAAFLNARIPDGIVEHIANTVSTHTNSDHFDIVPPSVEACLPAPPSVGTSRASGIGNKEVSNAGFIRWYNRHFSIKCAHDVLPDGEASSTQPQNWLIDGQDRKYQSTATNVQHVGGQMANKTDLRRRAPPDTLRPCFTTHLLEGGLDVSYIPVQPGCKGINNTLVYTHMTTSIVLIRYIIRVIHKAWIKCHPKKNRTNDTEKVRI